MASDDKAQGQKPPVTGESEVDVVNPPTMLDRPAEDVPEGEGSGNHGHGEVPVSVFDILDQMVNKEDPDTNALRRILEKDKSVIDARDETGSTALHIAAAHGLLGAAEVLLEFHANVSAQDIFQRQPLYIACFAGKKDIADLLLTNHADIEARVDGDTLLMAACWSGKSIATTLIDNGAKVDLRRDNGFTALHTAIYENYPSLVIRLLEKGAKPDIKDDDGWTALHFAARFSDGKTTTEVLQKSAQGIIYEPDSHGWTALHVASRQGNDSVVKLLLDNKVISSKVGINAQNNDENTALHLASGALGGGVMEHGPDDDDEGESEDRAIRQGAIIMELLRAGADSKMKNKKSETGIDLIMADDKPHRFQGLLAYLSQSHYSDEPLPSNSMSKRLGLEDLLVKPDFKRLLSEIVRQDSPGTDTVETLRSSLSMILEIVQGKVNLTLFEHIPPVLGLLISGLSPSNEL
ncbi:hypothetical protein ACHAQI_003755 [Fusarium lateritium]